VRSLLAAIVALAAAGCGPDSKCHMPIDWKPCAGQTAQPGSSGTPPTILELSLPTCAYVDTPTATGTLRVTDPDGDAQVLKLTLFDGARENEAEIQLDDAARSGNEWTGQFVVAITGSSGGKVMEGSSDLHAKVTDRAGAQSVPFCNSIAIVR
jgi:hypothetical protein